MAVGAKDCNVMAEDENSASAQQPEDPAQSETDASGPEAAADPPGADGNESADATATGADGTVEAVADGEHASSEEISAQDGGATDDGADPGNADASEESVDTMLGAAADAAGEVAREAAAAAATVDPPAGDLPEGAEAVDLPDFADAPSGGSNDLDLLDDVDLNVKIELGRTEMYVEDVLHLGVGSVVELDRLAGDPVDVYVNERLIGRGEVLVLNDNFCVRINEILNPVG
jgi:flagellar motor switch protein FliN/FliY